MTESHAVESVQGWMGKASRKWLARQARAHKRIIEVGCWKGLSTLTIAGATRGKVWAVDHWQGTPADPGQHERLYAAALEGAGPGAIYAEFRRNLAAHIRSRRVNIVRSDSVSAAHHLLGRHGRRFGWVFIDADHSYEGCSADIEAYRPLLRVGGLLSGHDYSDNWPGVRRAVDEAFGSAVKLGPSSIWSITV